jgi:hypothetical protein
LVNFLFPYGIHTSSIQRSQSMSSVNQVLYGALSQLESGNHSFVFLINTGESLLYGCCVCRDEFVSSKPSFLAHPSAPEEPQRYNTTTREQHRRRARLGKLPPLLVAPRCYCVLSRFPFFESHFTFLYK